MMFHHFPYRYTVHNLLELWPAAFEYDLSDKNGKSVLELIAPADCTEILFGYGADSDGYSVILDGKVLE